MRGVEVKMSELDKLVDSAGIVSLLNHGAASCVYSEGCHGVTQDHLERLIELVRQQERIASRAREDSAYVLGRDDERKQALGVKPAAIVRSIVAGEVRVKWLAGFPQIGDPLYYAAPENA